MTLWEMSSSGGILILAILAARRMFQDKLPKRTFLALWMVALVRLLVPYSVEVPYNAYTLLEGIGSIAGDRGSILAQGCPWGGAGTGTQGTEAELSSQELAEDSTIVVEQPAENLAHFPWAAIYLLGAMLCAAFYLAAYIKCRFEFRAALPVRDSAVLSWVCSFSLKRRVQVRQSGLIATPITYGVLQPVILLPKGIQWENQQQMQFVLTHELVHIQRLDAVRKALFLAAACVHWFNPLAWVMQALASRDMELACDERVLQYFGQEARAAYARSLISLAERGSSLAACGNGFGKHAMEERIVAILKNKKRSIRAMAGAAVVVLMVTLLFATSANQGKTKEPQDLEVYEGTDELGDVLRNLRQNVANSEEFPDYEKFGLSYEEESGHFYYNGEIVGYFKDEMAHQVYRRFTDKEGTIGLVVKRDNAWKMTGFQEQPELGK